MSVKFEVYNHVACVTIDRPERRNAVDEVTANLLEDAWQQIETDADIRVVVVTGTGNKAFCAGADLKAATDGKTGVDYWENRRPGGFGGLTMRKSLLVPVIARVNGVAVGGGFELVMGCDIVVAAEHATFGLPEPKVGFMPLDGGMVVLPRIVPEKVAMGMLLTGKRISATEAKDYGLVNDVVPEAGLDDAVNAWANQIVECAPLSLKAIKESVKETRHLTVEKAQAKRLPALIAALASEDAKEGPRAFQQKRKPVWTGK